MKIEDILLKSTAETGDLIFVEPHSEACDRWFYILSLIEINTIEIRMALQKSKDLDIKFCAYEQINKIPDSIEEDPDFGAYVILDSAE